MPTVVENPLGLRARVWGAFLCCHLASSGTSIAQEFLEGTELIDLRVGPLSSLATELSGGSGLLSDGTRYSFNRFYSTDLPDLRVTMFSPLGSDFGILWGFGTGERGSKYRIEPSIKIGFIAIRRTGKNAALSLSVSAVLAGSFRESSCTADYGQIGGVQEVNCRLADSLLPPKDTLKFLEKRRPPDQLRISVRYLLRF